MLEFAALAPGLGWPSGSCLKVSLFWLTETNCLSRFGSIAPSRGLFLHAGCGGLRPVLGGCSPILEEAWLLEGRSEDGYLTVKRISDFIQRGPLANFLTYSFL